MNGQWSRQRREIDAYNTFFAAVKGETTGEGFHNLGYRYVGRFLTVPDNRRDVEARPDFVLYNGETMLLVEVKSGSNINERDINQMERCAAISIEAGQQFLRDSGDLEDLEPSDLRQIQPCIVYYADFIEECKQLESCVDSLDSLKENALVLTQEKGDKLTLEGGDVHDKMLADELNSGFQLPEAPEKKIYLTEEVEVESLAFSICHHIVLNNLGRGRFELSPSGVREYYRNRTVPMERVENALRFLSEVGACRETEDGSYEFTTAHSSEIVSIHERLAEAPIHEWLEEDDNQASLADFD